MTELLIDLLFTLTNLFVLALLLRFLLQVVRADFYNPISQVLVKITSPALNPIRKIVPGFKGIDFASLVLSLLISIVVSALVFIIAGSTTINYLALAGICAVGIFAFILKIYFYGFIAYIILSWVAPFSGHPAILLIRQLIEPIQAPVRKIIPSIGGLDISPIFTFLILRFLLSSTGILANEIYQLGNFSGLPQIIGFF